MNGYVGRLLRVNLSNRSISIDPLNMKWAKDYIGCQGLGLRYLYEELRPGIDALAPENKIVVMTGPLVGTIAPSAQKYTLVTKSPLTRTFYDSTAGGHLGPELKYAGYDGIIIEGRSEKPVYLLIRNNRVEIQDAARIWGKDTHSTEDTLKGLWGDVKVMSIGPAGEKMVRFACVTSDYFRQNGRGGVGAVFGAKNLKAIVVKGSGGIGVADPEAFLRIARKCMIEKGVENPDEHQFIGWKGGMGTIEIMEWTNEYGCLPTRNWQTGDFDGVKKISMEAARQVKKKSRACAQCPMACSNWVEIKEGPYAGTALEGPEYETAALLGSNCGIDNFGAIAKMNLICDMLGMDTMAAGDVASWAMECYERRILKQKDTGGIALNFGDDKALVLLLEKIANRDGIGDLLAEGVAHCSQKMGKGTEEFAMHVKGLECPAYDPRVAIGMGLAYATSPPGATHTRGFPISAELFGAWWLGAEPVELDPKSPENKAKLLIYQQHWQAYRFSTGSCDFILLNPEDGLPEEVAACTGWPETADWKKIGERVVNLGRMFGIREGIDKKDDTLPPRLLKEVLKSGPGKGRVVNPEDLEFMLDEYYRLRGWDNAGRPTLDKLKDLDIEDLVRGGQS